MDIRDIIPWRRRRREALAPSSFFDEPFFSGGLLDEFFGRDFTRSRRFSPSIDVAEKDREIVVTAELPGLEEKDIDLTLDEHGLTLRGEKREEHEEEDGDYFRSERSFGSFQRYIPIDAEIDRENVRARFKNGILKVHLSKTGTSEERGKKIKIEG
ncbi:MAG TPA: Hsp20/alpha crystallin family protein [Opitutales bacterium]|nr:Hsp20/alpha crystallin family protein [Opitutales bacterium]